MIDLLIGMAISMAAVIIILSLYFVFESGRTEGIDRSEIQADAISILAMIDRDMRMAGYGIMPKDVYGCKVNRQYNDKKSDFNLLPVIIEDGNEGVADSITILASSKKNSGVSYALISPHPADASLLILNSNVGIEAEDSLVIHEPGKECTLVQVTDVSADNYRVEHGTKDHPWNPPTPNMLFPVSGYAAGANVLNLGQVIQKKYFINTNFELQVENYISSDNTKLISTIASDIVNIQFQYGFDTRNSQDQMRIVTKWSTAMLDADGSKIIGDNGDVRRMIAIRLAVVKRSLIKKIMSKVVVSSHRTHPGPQEMMHRDFWKILKSI